MRTRAPALVLTVERESYMYIAPGLLIGPAVPRSGALLCLLAFTQMTACKKTVRIAITRAPWTTSTIAWSWMDTEPADKKRTRAEACASCTECSMDLWSRFPDLGLVLPTSTFAPSCLLRLACREGGGSALNTRTAAVRLFTRITVFCLSFCLATSRRLVGHVGLAARDTIFLLSSM